MPSSAARALATSSIGSATSVMTIVPIGCSSSAARRPVSPGPAASSSIFRPGCGSTRSTSHCETGSAAAWNTARCAPHPAAARSQRSVICARSSSGVSHARQPTQKLPRGRPRQRGREPDVLRHLEARPGARARGRAGRRPSRRRPAPARRSRRPPRPIRSGRAWTAASATAGCASRTASTSAGRDVLARR